MPIPEWHEAIAQIQPYIFRITTPDGSGSGFLVSRGAKNTSLCVVATAAHVVGHSDYWDEPIRLHHVQSGETILLRPTDRSINIDYSTDTAGILFGVGDLTLPTSTLPLMQKDHYLKAGVEVGWVGFPAVSQTNLCFFSGHVSAYLGTESAYLVDGVAINGVSGGPAFRKAVDTAEVIGVVAAYIPNRATGDVLPGVAVVRDVNRYHDLADKLKTIDEAKEQQPPPIAPPPEPSTTRAGRESA